MEFAKIFHNNEIKNSPIITPRNNNEQKKEQNMKNSNEKQKLVKSFTKVKQFNNVQTII